MRDGSLSLSYNGSKRPFSGGTCSPTLLASTTLTFFSSFLKAFYGYLTYTSTVSLVPPHSITVKSLYPCPNQIQKRYTRRRRSIFVIERPWLDSILGTRNNKFYIPPPPLFLWMEMIKKSEEFSYIQAKVKRPVYFTFAFLFLSVCYSLGGKKKNKRC